MKLLQGSDYKKGTVAAIFTQIFWGFCPIYWKALIPIDSGIIIIYRILTVALYAFAAALFIYGWDRIIEPLRDRRTRRIYFGTGLIITCNWSIYIWAINADHAVQAAIGYYIEPLVICLMGIVIFREKVTKWNLAAMLFGLVAVVIMIAHFGEAPWIALSLAFSFAIYSGIKKTVSQPPILTMLYETMWFAPLALIAIFYMELQGKGALAAAPAGKYCLMLLCGLMTLIPLSSFAYAAKRTSLFTIGLAQYIAPSMTLVTAVLLFGEPVDRVQFIAFGIIWIGLIIFSIGEFRKSRMQK